MTDVARVELRLDGHVPGHVERWRWERGSTIHRTTSPTRVMQLSEVALCVGESCSFCLLYLLTSIMYRSARPEMMLALRLRLFSSLSFIHMWPMRQQSCCPVSCPVSFLPLRSPDCVELLCFCLLSCISSCAVDWACTPTRRRLGCRLFDHLCLTVCCPLSRRS